MVVPHSDSGDVGREAVLIPLRSLREGKARLDGVLDPDERNDLISEMARSVIIAAHDLDVLVVHDDPNVAPWATDLGAQTLRPDESGLNNAVTAGRDHLRKAGYERVIIAHGDLPHARDLRVMSTPHEITIAPDRHGEGTNVLALPTALDFEFSYGPGSFERHVQTSRSHGIEPHIVLDPGLAWDVDTPDDLDLSRRTINEDSREAKH